MQSVTMNNWMKKLLTLLTVLWMSSGIFAQRQGGITVKTDSLSLLINELEMIDEDSAGVYKRTLNKDSIEDKTETSIIMVKKDSVLQLKDSLGMLDDSLAAGYDGLTAADDSVKMTQGGLMHMADSLNRANDSLYVVNDSLATVNDSLTEQIMDEAEMDSMMMRLDDLLKKNDSLMIVRDSLVADSIRKVEEYKRTHTPQLMAAAKLVAVYQEYRQAWTDKWDDIYIYSSEVVSDADYYKLSMPATYYNIAIEQAVSIDKWRPEIPFLNKDTTLIAYPYEDVRKAEKVDRYINRELLGFYVNYPSLVKQNESVLEKLTPLSKDLMVNESKPENLKEKVNPMFDVGRVTENDLLVLKPNFWTLGGGGYLNFSQNYISENWYKGGESSISLLSGLEFQANFDNKQKVQFENKLEWKLGFITTPSDTVHAYKANNDLLRLTSKLGIKAFKSWYYTLSLEFKTQLFSSYATNSNNLVSALLSPAELNVGIGMDYKFIKDGKCNLSLLLKPLNYTMYSVLSDDVDPTKFNIEKGLKIRNVIGSRVDVNLKWMIAKSLVWESKFIYSTNYETTFGDWENRFSYSFNKFLSTNLFVNARFDDGVKKTPDSSYFQLQEILGFGVSYVW